MLVIILTSPSSFTDDPLLDIPPEMLSLRFPSVQGTTTRQETKSEVSPPNREKQTFKVSQVQVINFVVKINFQKNDFTEPSMFRPADVGRFPHFPLGATKEPAVLHSTTPIVLNTRLPVSPNIKCNDNRQVGQIFLQ